MFISPRSISIGEHDPDSVASYNVRMLDAAGVVLSTQTGIASDPTGVQTIHVGDPGGVVHEYVLGTPGHPEVLDTQIKLEYQQVGRTGATTDWIGVGDAAGHGSFACNKLPDGAESAVVNL